MIFIGRERLGAPPSTLLVDAMFVYVCAVNNDTMIQEVLSTQDLMLKQPRPNQWSSNTSRDTPVAGSSGQCGTSTPDNRTMNDDWQKRGRFWAHDV